MPLAARLPVAELPPARQAERRLGHWQVKELIGRSAASTAWLADDVRSGHEMVLHLPRARPRDAAAAETWLREARRGARLDHPRIAAVMEMAAPDGWPCLAVDRRLGVSLDAWQAAHPAATVADCVALVQQALEGLAYAHDAGVVHGDLQSHHCLVDDHGQLRLAAFGVGIRQPGDSAGAFDPAHLRATRDAGARDVLAAGLLLHRLLAGRPALDEPDVGLACDRLPPHGRDTVRLPRTLPQPVPDALRSIVDRATAREPRHRYLNARTLLAALDGWRQSDAGTGGGPLAWLLDRMRVAGHLPAAPDIGGRIERLLGGEQLHAGALARSLLPDLGLAVELLRLVNSIRVQGAQAAGGEPVLALSRAVGLLGIDGVRRAAAALPAWPGMAGETHAAALQALVDRVRQAARLAQALRPAGYDAEAVYLIAVLQNLGRLLVQVHFPEQAAQIRLLMRPAPAEGGVEGLPRVQASLGEEAASYAVLGADVASLGIAVAQQWGFQMPLIAAMRRVDRERPVGVVEGDWALLRATASAANEAVDALAAIGEGHGARAAANAQAALAVVAQRYARVLRLGTGELQAAIRDSDTGPAGEAPGE